MGYRFAYICLLVCCSYKFGHSEITCGHLKVVYDYKANSVDCRIRLYPSIELQTVIKESHFYRWILTRNISSSIVSDVILQKNIGSYNKTKYNEENFTLLIRNLTSHDVGRYEVECWSRGDVFYNSDKVTVTIPKRPTDKPGSRPSPSPLEGERLGNITIIVISICVVLIVGIISGTVYLIIAKQRGGIKGIKRLVSDEGTSALGHVRHVRNEDPSSIYNEIDTEEMILDYAKVEKIHSKPTQRQFKETIVPVQSPNKEVTIATNDDDYDLVNINAALVGQADDMEVEYADIIVELPTETTEVVEAGKNMTEYNYVKMASNRLKDNDDEPIVIVDKRAKPSVSDMKDADAYSDVNDTKGPIYAKVSKKNTKSYECNKKETRNLSDNEYSIQFPDINYSDITHSLDNSCYNQQVAQSQREPAMYSNLVSRPQRDKFRLSRASRRELQYAVLDLPDHDSTSFLENGQEVKGLTKLQTCLYDDIDFEKKAFVAPIRKAPSSWYTRKNRGGKHRNA